LGSFKLASGFGFRAFGQNQKPGFGLWPSGFGPKNLKT